MRMNCTLKIKDRIIVEYICGDLAGAERTKFEEHLLECAACFQKVQFLEKATLLIRVEGKKAFEHQPIFSKRTKSILEFFRRMGTIRLPKVKFVFPTVLAGLVTCSFFIYVPLSNRYISELPSSVGALKHVRDAGESDSEFIKTDYKLTRGYAAYVNKDYVGALALFNSAAFDLKTDDHANRLEEKRFETQLALGIATAALWKHENYSYFQWIKDWTHLGSVDLNLLKEAEQHLSQAQELAEILGTRSEDMALISDLLATIRKKLDSQ